MKKLSLLCTLALLVNALSGCAEVHRAPAPSASPVVDRVLAAGVLRVGMSGDMPPLNMTTREKAHRPGRRPGRPGRRRHGRKLSVQKMAFAELLPALEAGRIDMIISNMTMTPGRNLKVAFVGPYFTSGKGLLTKRSTLAEVKKMEDLNNPAFTFVALKGSTSEAVAKAGAPKAKLIAVASENEGVQMVLDGKADGMLADFPICAVAADRYPNAGLVPAVAPITYEPIGIAVPKGDPHLVNLLHNLLHGMEKAGFMKELGEKWFGKPTWVDQLK